MFSVVIGLLRKGDPVADVLKGEESFVSGSVDTIKRNRERIEGSGFVKGIVIGKPGRRGPAVCEWVQSGGIERKGMHSLGKREEGQWRADQLFHLSQTVITELKPRIWAAGIQKQGKQDLLLTLLRFLKSYTALTVLQAYPFRIAINNFIEKETATRCSIHLNNEELLALWRDVR
jgi:hypothetical protein